MSKRIWQHPELPADETTVAWRSTGQLENTAEFREWMEREFPRGAAEMANQEEVETSRRSFLKLMGASTALAGFGMAACRRPEAHILPYAQAPEWVIPGKATYYASSFPRMGGATPLVVTSYEGRPTKVAPNTLHPDDGGTDAFAQASILDIYSPYRSTRVLESGSVSTPAAFSQVFGELRKDSSAKVGFLFGRDDSPTRARLRKEISERYPNAKFYAYEALEGEALKAAGNGQAYVADFSKADRILALDCDFASLERIGPVTPFFDRRKPEGPDYDSDPSAERLNRLYAVESAFSLTGGMADHRLKIKPSQLLQVAAWIAKGLGADAPTGAVDEPDERLKEWIAPLVEDLRESGSRSMVVAGTRLPEVVHHFVAAINEKLGNVGEDKPLRFVTTGNEGLGDLSDLVADLESGDVEHVFLMSPSNPVFDAPADLEFPTALAKAKTSIHLGLRTDATAHAASWHVPACHYLENWADTRSATGVHTVVQPLILPLYAGCISELELLAAFVAAPEEEVPEPDENETPVIDAAGEPPVSAAYVEVRKTFEGLAGDDEEAWKKFLRDGFLEGTRYDSAAPAVDRGRASELASKAPKNSDGELEVIFATDSTIYDGRWIDNGWLQEAPDPISKVSWDNVALIAPKTAQRLGIYDEVVALQSPTAAKPSEGEGEHRQARLVALKVNGKVIEVPVQLGYGQAEDTVVVSVGYGQGFNEDDELGRGVGNTSDRFVGLVGVNTGFDVYPARTLEDGYFAAVEGAPVLGLRYKIAAVQEHHSMYGRALAREVSTLMDKKKGDFKEQLASVKKHGMDSHIPPNISLYKPQDQEGKPLINDHLHQWGMSIDLSSCMGCNACLVACQAENNIPIVGKEQLAMGREMHWIRMDRYFAVQPLKDEQGNYVEEDEKKVYDEENIEMIPQPVACVQCEAAPCETVCPVNATVHTEDGLNAMAYNRCIGTRYCANNCPYKARRFNFFDYNKRNPLIPHNLYRGPLGEKQVNTAASLQRNPNVTVRMRGVMEKCTYCVQRLKDSKIRQKRRQKQDTLDTGDSTGTRIGTQELRIPADSVKVACQEACPADAIAFGNLLDGPDSRMVRAKGNDTETIREIVTEERYDEIAVKGVARSYDLLNYIGTRPRTGYLARVKNPNKAMPGAQSIGKATIHMH